MTLDKIEITPSELDALTVWIFDSLKLNCTANLELFAKLRTKLELFPVFRVVTWRKKS